MVKVDDNSEEVTLYFPKNEETDIDNYTVTLHSNLTLNDYTYTVADEGSLENFYKFTLDLSDLKEGEYTYTIDNYTCGLLTIGNYTPKNTKYNKNQTYTQYERD